MARPTDDPKNCRLDLRLPGHMVDAIDEWRRMEKDIPARAEAIRRLVGKGIATGALIEIITLQNRAMSLLGEKRTPERVADLIRLYEEIAEKIDVANSAYGVNAPRPAPYRPPGAVEVGLMEEPQAEQLPYLGDGRRVLRGLTKPKN